jgi:hypothetical protein
MSILLSSLAEYLGMKEDLASGQIDQEQVFEAKKRTIQALDEYIDYRIALATEERSRQRGSDRVSIANAINSAVKGTAASVKSLTALNAAPIPPQDVTNVEAMKKWQESYKEWYDNQRRKGLDIG